VCVCVCMCVCVCAYVCVLILFPIALVSPPEIQNINTPLIREYVNFTSKSRGFFFFLSFVFSGLVNPVCLYGHCCGLHLGAFFQVDGPGRLAPKHLVDGVAFSWFLFCRVFRVKLDHVAPKIIGGRAVCHLVGVVGLVVWYFRAFGLLGVSFFLLLTSSSSFFCFFLVLFFQKTSMHPINTYIQESVVSAHCLSWPRFFFLHLYHTMCVAHVN
jgi:hypothetical protein